jgi:hypothetical protein
MNLRINWKNSQVIIWKACFVIHSDVSNKPDLTVDDLSISTSHAPDYELDSIDIKPVIDTACLDNSCLTNHVMQKSMESGIQGKFIPWSY